MSVVPATPLVSGPQGNARIVSAIMFLGMAGRPDPAFRVEDIVQDVRSQILLPR
jgi:hypothetical protein